MNDIATPNQGPLFFEWAGQVFDPGSVPFPEHLTFFTGNIPAIGISETGTNIDLIMNVPLLGFGSAKVIFRSDQSGNVFDKRFEIANLSVPVLNSGELGISFSIKVNDSGGLSLTGSVADHLPSDTPLHV